MKKFRVEVIEENVWEAHPEMWADEELESDAIDLEEWAFVRGYYGELE